MNLHTSTKIPFDDQYAALLGKAIYVFNYYEWRLIYLIEWLGKIGFVHTYSREKIFTADGVRKQLLETIENLPESFDVVLKSDLHAIHEQFADLIIRRNALVHAHPITDEDGSQISGYQAHTSKPIPDIDWRKGDIEALIQAIDVAATGNLSRAFEALRPKPN